MRTATILAGAIVVGLLLASCGATTGAVQTITQTVVQTAPRQAGDSADGSTAGPSGAGITVVAPTPPGANTAQTGPPGAETSAAPEGGESSGIAETSTSAVETTSTQPDVTTSSSAPATLDRVARAALRTIGTQCDAVLRRADVTKALGDAVSAEQIQVSDVANTNNQMVGRNKCYYGTSDLATARPLVVALAAFGSEDAAANQLSVTISSEKDAGAAASTVDVSGHEVELLLRDGGFATVQVGAVTVSIAIAKGVVADAKLKTALTSLMGAALAHLG